MMIDDDLMLKPFSMILTIVIGAHCNGLAAQD